MTTTKRNIRVPDHIWASAQARAAVEGRTVSAVVVEALRKYGEGR